MIDINKKEITVLLLVEDDSVDAEFIIRKIKSSVYNVEKYFIAQSSTEIKKIIQDEEIDLMLLDLNITDTKGLETLDFVRKIFNGVIIILTSMESTEMAQAAISQGADEYIIKNRENEDLLNQHVAYAQARRKVRNTSEKINEKIKEIEKIQSEIKC